MAISVETAQKATTSLKKHDTDTGSAEFQIALLTTRILSLTEHMKLNKKDLHSQRGLLQMVGRRKKLLAYLKQSDFESYQKVTKELGIRK